MTKSEFMRKLSGLLSGIPEEEKQDALQYYEDYFAEAGIMDDMPVPERLGTPRQIADKIIQETTYGDKPHPNKETIRNVPSDPNGAAQQQSGFSGAGQQTYYANAENRAGAHTGNGYGNQNGFGTTQDNQTYYGNGGSQRPQKNNSGSGLVLGIILLIFTFPIWFSILATLFGLVVGLLAGLFGIVIGLGVTGITMIGCAFLASGIAGGLLMSGVGLILIAVALLALWILVLVCVKFFPWLIDCIGRGLRRMFGRKEGAA